MLSEVKKNEDETEMLGLRGFKASIFSPNAASLVQQKEIYSAYL